MLSIADRKVVELAPGLEGLEKLTGMENITAIQERAHGTELGLLMWQVTSLIQSGKDLTGQQDPYAQYVHFAITRPDPLPGALLLEALKSENYLVRVRVGGRKDADMNVLTQVVLDDLRLSQVQATSSFVLGQNALPLWLFRVACDVHKFFSDNGDFAKFGYRLSRNTAIPVQARAWVSNQKNSSPVKVARRYEWAEQPSYEKGILSADILELVEANWPELVGLPFEMLLDVLSTQPVTDPEWWDVPAVWQSQVDVIYKMIGGK